MKRPPGTTWLGLAALLLCAACAPAPSVVRVVDVRRIPMQSEWVGPERRHARVELVGSTVVVNVVSARACMVVDREARTLEERRDRDPSKPLLYSGGAVAALGLLAVLAPSDCNDDRTLGDCLGDAGRKAMGMLAVITGAGLAIGGLAKTQHTRRTFTEQSYPRRQLYPICALAAGTGSVVMLGLDDGTTPRGSRRRVGHRAGADP